MWLRREARRKTKVVVLTVAEYHHGHLYQLVTFIELIARACDRHAKPGVVIAAIGADLVVVRQHRCGTFGLSDSSSSARSLISCCRLRASRELTCERRGGARRRSEPTAPAPPTARP